MSSQTRYISRSRAEASELEKQPWFPCSFNIVTNSATNWVIVPDDDPRAETVKAAANTASESSE